MTKSNFDIILILVSVTIIFVIPLLGYMIYAIIKGLIEKSLIKDVNPRILAELSSSEAVSQFTYGEYLDYRKYLIKRYLIGLVMWNGIIALGLIILCFRDGIDFILEHPLTMLIEFVVIPNVFLIIVTLIKFLKIGNGEDVLRIRCHILKESRVHTKDPEFLVVFYDFDKGDFRKYRVHSRYRGFGTQDYILARHGSKKMKVICFYDPYLSFHSMFGNL